MSQQKTPDPRQAGPTPPHAPQTQSPSGSEARMLQKPDFGYESYRGHDRLKDRVAIITGGDSGIGRAIALAFAREGAHIAIAYLENDEDAKETQRVVEEAGSRAFIFTGDIGKESVCQELIQKTIERLGKLDILVNNAAFQDKTVKRFEDITAERIQKTFETNIMSIFHLVRFALPYLKPGAVIINTASSQAYQPSAEILDYASTKGAVVTFTKGLAQELIKRGIRVNAVAPGPVWTPLIQQSFDASKVATFGAQSPMERPAQPAEVAPAFVFLACDETSYINGEILGVTGGKPLG